MPGSSTGMTIMIREVGVRRPRGTQSTFDQWNQSREDQDSKLKAQVVASLTGRSIQLQTDDLLVLAQPSWSDQQLYWKSIEDFLRFTARDASQRTRISGESLLKLFSHAKTLIMKIPGLSNPSITLETIQTSERNIRQHFAQLNASQLRYGIDTKFVPFLMDKCTRDFEATAKALLPHVLTYSQSETSKQQDLTGQMAKSQCRQFFMARCVDLVLPILYNETLQNVKKNLTNATQRRPVPGVEERNFTRLLAEQQQFAEGAFRDAARCVDVELSSTSTFSSNLNSLRREISTHVNTIESARKREYRQCVDAENKRKEQEEAERQRILLEQEKRRADEQRWQLEQAQIYAFQRRRDDDARIQWQREEQARREAQNGFSCIGG
jgi:hypothetical protein